MPNINIMERLQLRLEHWDEYHPNMEPCITDKQFIRDAINEIRILNAST